MMKTTVNRSRYDELKKYPVFFLKFFENIVYSDNSQEQFDFSYWYSTDHDLNITIKDKDFGNRMLGYTLCIADKEENKGDKKEYEESSNFVDFTFHEVDPNNVNDWKYIINCYVSRTQDYKDKYACMELLWSLDKLPWKTSVLQATLSKYSTNILPFLTSSFQKLGRCLSCKKQEMLKVVCAAYNEKYDLYFPQILVQAYRFLNIEKFLSCKENIFSVIDRIFSRQFEKKYFSNTRLTI